MIPSDIRLYTWIDVEEVFERVQLENNWPEWLVWVRAYWDGVTLGIQPNHDRDAISWISEQFDPRFDQGNRNIILESTREGKQRTLCVTLEPTKDEQPNPHFAPSLARPSTLWSPIKREGPRPLPEDLPPIISFHSFKGGVGRTLLAIALAQAIPEKVEGSKILLIDADLEAPGISWLIRSRLPNPEISFVDFLALIHGDSDSSYKSSIELTAERMREMLVDNIYLMPAFRSIEKFSTLEVRPEYLIQGAKDSYILTSVLAELGKILNVQAVIVDLRAGLSELATGLLLDPRVYRVLVTTLSSQSILGTCRVLELLGEYSPAIGDEEPLPTIIYSRVPRIWQNMLDDFDRRLLDSGQIFWNIEDQSQNEQIPDFFRIVSLHDDDLMVLPDRWEEISNLIKKTDIPVQLDKYIQKIPLQLRDDKANKSKYKTSELINKRQKLTDFAHRLIFAETGDVESFLTIEPLRRLSNDFQTKVPIAIVVGAKGSGKTYTYLQIARHLYWGEYISKVLESNIQLNVHICPILWSKMYD